MIELRTTFSLIPSVSEMLDGAHMGELRLSGWLRFSQPIPRLPLTNVFGVCVFLADLMGRGHHNEIPLIRE
jgi:hypothetical protein